MDRESLLLQLLAHPRALRLSESGPNRHAETRTVLPMLERFGRPTNDVYGLSHVSHTRPNPHAPQENQVSGCAVVVVHKCRQRTLHELNEPWCIKVTS
jgi:hypothetical protein